MSIAEDLDLYMLNGECPSHGDGFIVECRVCGREFCARCFPNSSRCQECANEESFNEDEDMQSIDAVVEVDEEVEKILDESDDMILDMSGIALF
jgi:hypothetical protein